MQPIKQGRRTLPFLPMAVLMSACGNAAPHDCVVAQRDVIGIDRCLVPHGTPVLSAEPIPGRKPA